jgi:hypothetical protein
MEEIALEQAEAASTRGARAMSNPVLGMVMLGSFIFVILLGFPVAFTLMAMGIGFGYLASATRSSTCWCSAPTR